MKNDILALAKILKKIYYILSPKQRMKSYLITILIILGSLLEMLGISAILPFVQAILDPYALLENDYFAFFAKIFGLAEGGSIIFFIGSILILVYMLKNIFLSLISYMQINFRWQMQKELSTTMLNAYMRRPYVYFLNTNSAEVLRGIQDDVNSFYTVIENLFTCFSNILTITFIGGFLCISDFALAISVLLIAGGCFCIITFKFRKLLSGVGVIKREANAEERKYAYQAINGIKEINVLQRKNFFLEKYKGAYEKSVKANIKFTFLNTLPIRIIEAVCVSGIIVVVCFRYNSGVIDAIFISKMASFVVAAFKILPLIGALIGTINHLVYYWAGVDATYKNLIRNKEEMKDSYIQNDNIRKNEPVQLLKLKDRIKISNISWTYPNSKAVVLKNLSIEICKGQSVAFIGTSGAGKTTLADIVLGLYKPQEGEITVDGIDISTIPYQWSKMIGYVPQQVFLIDDTIKNNIAFGIYENEIDEQAVWKALEKAQLSEFVKTLPEGLNTKVGERGIKFSGGQRQRVAIARTLYYDPEILVFDEATSALDHETETAVMESIDMLRGEKTLLIIAHRLSTIANCDKIYEIMEGKAVLKQKEEVLEGL